MVRRFTVPGLLLFSLVLSGCAGTGKLAPPHFEPNLADRPPLTVVFPRPTPADTLLAASDSVIVVDKLTDSLFIFGSVNDPRAKVLVNDQPARMFENGGWLAWVKSGPVDTLASAPGIPNRALTSTVTIRRVGPSKEGDVGRRVHLVAPADKLESWELPRHPVDRKLVVTESNAKIRIGWPGTTDLYPSQGTVLHAIEASGAGDSLLYKLDLPGPEDLWIEGGYVRTDSQATLPDLQIVHKAVANVDKRWTRVRIPLKAKVPFRVDRVADGRLELTLYGAVSWTDVIIQPTGSKVVNELRWSQPDSARYRLTAFLNPAWFWGWNTSWEGDTTLVWSIHQAPEVNSGSLDGLTIVVDPGHGGDNISAIGPTGLWESRANLSLGLAIAGELKRAGATVHVTRSEDVTLGLPERIDFARSRQADFLISVHHNALPQGKNPWVHHGSSLHYVHRHSKLLADALYEELTADGQAGDGVRYQDLALARPTWLPAVLLEAGYLLHPDEEQEIRTQKYRKKIAKRVRKGFERYLEELREAQESSKERLETP